MASTHPPPTRKRVTLTSVTIMEDRPAPVVTITDPRRPLDPGDVLVVGDEKPPWRAKRKHYEALALVLALGLAVVIPQQLVSARAADHRADLAAVDAARVSVSLITSGVEGDDVKAIVSSEGPDPITVLSLHLVAEGYSAITVDAPVVANGLVEVVLPDALPCADSLLSSTPGGIASVRLRVAGRVVTRSVVPYPMLFQALTTAAQNRCGYLPGSRALGVTAGVRFVGEELAVTLALTNKGRLPLVVNPAYLFNPGMLVLGIAGSVVIAPGTTSSPYRFRVRVHDCVELRSAGEGAPVQLQVDTETRLRGGATAGESVDVTQLVPRLQDALQSLVTQRCGGR